MTVAIDITEATISDLLENIQRGDRVQLQRAGKTIATLAPGDATQNNDPDFIPRTPAQRAEARAALEDIDRLGKELNLGPFDFEQFLADKEYGRK